MDEYLRDRLWLGMVASLGLFGFTALFLLTFICTAQGFFPGGAFKCLVVAIQHASMAMREQAAFVHKTIAPDSQSGYPVLPRGVAWPGAT